MIENNAVENTIREKKDPTVREVVLWIVDLLRPFAVLALVFVLLEGVFAITFVPTGSMEPTVPRCSLVLQLRAPFFGDVRRGDILSFRYYNNILLKRVIGLPGDVIDLIDGKVYINGERYDESEYLDESVRTEVYHVPDHYEVPEGCYFMMGDNRENSYDSRYWLEHYMPEDAIVSKKLVGVDVPFLLDLARAQQAAVRISSEDMDLLASMW